MSKRSRAPAITWPDTTDRATDGVSSIYQMTDTTDYTDHIRPATDADEEWIGELFEQNSDILGPFSTAWWRWQNSDTDRNKWVVIEPIAFAHYLERQDGVVTLYEIAVDNRVKRAGLGSTLLDYMGYPMKLKTDADNAESNLFYQRQGFELVDKDVTSSGKLVNIYFKDEDEADRID